MATADITPEVLRSLLTYDSETGDFTWGTSLSKHVDPTIRSWGKRLSGKRAGIVSDKGYRIICINRRKYRAHHLAWLYVYGCLPPEFVDHINGVRDDNRIANLRLADVKLNRQNIRKPYRKNSGLPLGVWLNKKPGPRPYVAAIRHEGSSMHIGCYATPEEAHDAYLRVKRTLHPGCTL